MPTVAPRREGRLPLVDGRRLAWCEWGDPSGHPVVLWHGMPGGRWFCPDARATAEARVRLITFDRPGYGDSHARDGDEQPTLLDTVADVDALVDALVDERTSGSCAAIGWSGGGPFACAYACARPERVERLALVSAPGPLDEVPGAWERLGDYRRPTAEMARREPARSRRAIARHMEPFLADPPSFLGRGRGPDGAVLDDPVHGAMLREQICEALRPGAAGLASDLVASWLDWGFRLRDVTTPTRVFHGARDPHNDVDTETLATRLADAARTVWPTDGHLGVVRHWREVLAAVVVAAPSRD